MALSIKDPETERLARDLARLTGENITTATRRAIEERLRRVAVIPASHLAGGTGGNPNGAGARCRSSMTERQIRSSVMMSMDCRADGD